MNVALAQAHSRSKPPADTPLPRTWLHWLAAAALIDWLVGRTLTRAAISMPKSPALITAYEAWSAAGNVVMMLTAVLAVGALTWIARAEWRAGRARGLAWLVPPLFSLVFMFVAPAGWVALAYHASMLLVVSLVLQQVWAARRPAIRAAATIPALALLMNELYQIAPAAYSALRWAGPPPGMAALYSAGELLVALSPFGLWWALARDAGWRTWLAAAGPPLVFAAAYFANPALTGILSIWSIGLTLYLPWPIYALSLWLAGVTVIATLRRGSLAGWAILLLAAGGYAPQLSAQAFLGLIGLRLLAPDYEAD